MNIIKEDTYTINLSPNELRIIHAAMSDYSKDKSNIEKQITDDIYYVLI